MRDTSRERYLGAGRVSNNAPHFVQDKSGVGFRVTSCCPLSYTKLHVFSPNVRGDCLGLHLWEILHLWGG